MKLVDTYTPQKAVWNISWPEGLKIKRVHHRGWSRSRNVCWSRCMAIPTPTSLQRPCHCNFYFIKSRDQIPSLPNPNVNIMVVHLAFTISLNPTWTEGSANVNVENALQYQKLQKLSYYINSTYIDTCSVTSHEKNWHFLIIFAFACKAKSFGIAFLFFVFLECFFTFVSENVNQDARDQYRTNFVGNTGK